MKKGTKEPAGIRLIASDLDGTLLRDDKTVDPLAKELLCRAAAEGIHFVPATGRPLASVPGEVLAIPGVRYVITSNGAAIYSFPERKRVYQQLLARESAKKLLSLPVPEEMATEVTVEGVPYTEGRYLAQPERFGATGFGVGYVKRTRKKQDPIHEFAQEHLEELDGINFICGDPRIREDFRRVLLTEFPELCLTSSVPHLLEISSREANKGAALSWLLKRLAILPSEAAAFGDADNDSSMLSGVSYGIAMGNATEGCKQMAWKVTATNEEGGVGRMLRELLSAEEGLS